MKAILFLALVMPVMALASPIYHCGNLYTDNVKLCSTPVVVSINATPPQKADPQRTCKTNPDACSISKE